MSSVDGIGLIGFLPGLLVGTFAVIVLMVDLFSPPGQPANSGVIALIGIGLAFWAVIRLWGSSAELFGGMIIVDMVSLLFQSIFLVVGFVTVLLSIRYAAA
jgi:NADH:ubiquinone oxidoreductase subunit 2 (subunit N)